jgi:hypothetical protein
MESLLTILVSTFTSLEPDPKFSHTKTVIHYGLDELMPLSLVGKTGLEAINELKKNNLANNVLDVYYRIKRNIEYMSQGKESLYSVAANYPTEYPRQLLNSRNSREYLYLIHKYTNVSFGHIVSLASHLVQNNKMRLEQNVKGLQGPRRI